MNYFSRNNCVMKYFRFYIIVYLLFLFSCDHGIDPGEPVVPTSSPSGISGTIFYQNWPTPDSLYNLKLVIFKSYPPVDIVGEVTGGSAIAYPATLDENLPYNVDSTNYMVELDKGRYEYIAIAQQYGPGIFFDWRAVGQYDTTLYDSIPTAVNVFEDSITININIYVDFDSLPGQPF